MQTLARFLVYAATAALLCALGIVIAFDFLTAANRHVPYSYPQFLIENIAAPRIIIDAGSSSMIGITPELIEQTFKTPVIDVADNGSIPLDAKVYRILDYARPGDTLILPLEWVYYTRNIVPQDFINATPNEYAAYYTSQPFFNRLRFVVEHLSLHNMSDAVRLYLRRDLREVHTRRILDHMAKQPWGDRKDDGRRKSSVEHIGCADYIAASGEIDPIVTWAAQQLATLQAERRVRIYLTWPAVAGTGCYTFNDGQLPLAEAARKLYQAHGLTVIGDPKDSLFEPEHMLDTYYHVDSSAARIRTERLIARLQTAGMQTGNDPRGSTLDLARQAARSLDVYLPAAPAPTRQD